MIFIVVLYITLALGYLVWCSVGNYRQNTKWLKATLKISPIVTLLCHVITKTSATQDSRLATLLIALLFSLLGDWLLVYQNSPIYFILGIVTFGVQQILYTSLFGFSVDGIFPIGLIVAVVSIMIYFYLLPKMKRFLILPSAVYCILIGCMLWRALVRFNKYGGSLNAAGAVLFYVSDSLLAINKFRHRIAYGDTVIMITYYTAQLFITVANSS